MRDGQHFTTPITSLVVKVFMNAAMNDCLERLKAGIEGSGK